MNTVFFPWGEVSGMRVPRFKMRGEDLKGNYFLLESGAYMEATRESG